MDESTLVEYNYVVSRGWREGQVAHMDPTCRTVTSFYFSPIENLGAKRIGSGPE